MGPSNSRQALGAYERRAPDRKDSKRGKPTYVSAMGVARARALAEDLRSEAHAALSGMGAPATRLAEVADFIVLRKF